MERRANMNPMTAKGGCGKAVTMMVLALAFVIGSCASGTILKWNQVDAGALMRGDAGRQSYNAIRFETFGPTAEQLFGYFLYKDGVEVVAGEGIPLTKMGKKTLQEVMADYDQAKKSRMYTSGSSLVVREVLRGDSVVGYTASDLNIDVQLWDITWGDETPVLRLVYKDLRGDSVIPDPRRQRRVLY
jgi:hypothetical protein